MTDITPKPETLLQYNEDHKVLVCQQCRYAIQPRGIDWHLKEIHKLYRGTRRPFTAYASKFDLREPEDIIATRILRFPVPYLPVYDGLRCLEPLCDYLCISEKRAQKHWLLDHGRHGYRGKDWQAARLQTFFRGKLLRYFTEPLMSPGEMVFNVSSSVNALHSLLTNIKLHSEKQLKSHIPSVTAFHYNTPSEPSGRELLDHYQTSTCKTLVSPDEDLWRFSVPSLATANPFLMHAILACSALHLSSKHPSRPEYLICAHNYQNLAMAQFRDAVALVDTGNCNAIIAFTHLLIVYSLGAERQDECLLFTNPTSEHPNRLCSWLFFVRNGCTLVREHKQVIFAGPLARLAYCWQAPTAIIDERIEQHMTEHLLSIMYSSQDTSWPPNETSTLEDATRLLGHAFAWAEALGQGFSTWDAVRVWPVNVSVTFTDMLAEEHPFAMVLLGYYCLLLRKLRSFWFVGTYPLGLLRTISGKLDGRWRRYVEPLIEQWEKEG